MKRKLNLNLRNCLEEYLKEAENYEAEEYNHSNTWKKYSISLIRCLNVDL